MKCYERQREISFFKKVLSPNFPLFFFFPLSEENNNLFYSFINKSWWEYATKSLVTHYPVSLMKQWGLYIMELDNILNISNDIRK